MKYGALLLSGVVALVPSALSASQHGAAADEVSRFEPPSEPLILTRIVQRDLPDGKSIIVQRSYQVRFAAEGDGFRVDGQPLATRVDAPEQLQRLAEIERNRPNTGLFPIMLDSVGRIVSRREQRDAGAVVQASAVLESQANHSGMPQEDRAVIGDLVNQLTQRGAEIVWPSDLFRPQTGRRSFAQNLALPNGVAGEVITSTEARSEGASGLLATFDRTSVTRFQGSERATHETWTLRKLTPAP